MPQPATKSQTIEELRKRFEDMNRKKITAEANHKNAERQLNELKTAARSQWGTDDIDQLREKLKEMEAENERKRIEYQAELDRIEANLRSINEKFTQTQEKK